ncbi:response regulator [Paenibacillus sp. HWE-109]|uniref:response regulator n=1 Tax=Paenibacillus sp. HWE-109 TaxID=1306526 RepID=UPI001EDE5402|nr:response regulator [Paenibacillus sp. HWE-109]UKS28222.1 response regulator [Paenibacillus sp. HWE-109]
MMILVVDDERLPRTSLAGMIRSIDQKHVVMEAENTNEALELFILHSFDLVISDIRMPGKDGLDLVKEIREMDEEANVVLLSGYADFEYAVTGIRLRIFEYVTKPVNKQQMTELLRKMEDRLAERKSKNTLNRLRDRSMLEKRIRDWCHDIPIPYYDEMLLPGYSEIALFHIVASNLVEMDHRLRFFLKNIFGEMLSELGIPVFVDEIRQVTVVFFSQNVPEESLLVKIKESQQEVEQLIRESLTISWGGNITDLAAIPRLYQQSLMTLGTDSLADLPTVGASHYLVKKAIELIQQHYADDISLLTLGEQLHVNPTYLGRLFKKEIDMNFTDYLVRIRMDHAKRLLKQTTLKVYEIAHEVGYEDNTYFSRLFKALHAMTPNAYRNLDKS